MSLEIIYSPGAEMSSPHRLTNWYRAIIIKENYLHKILPLSIGVIFFMNSACEPKDDLYLALDFEIPVSVYPAKEIYHVGDTLPIEILFPKNLPDKTGNYSPSFESFDFQGVLIFRELRDKNQDSADQPGAFGSVRLINSAGSIEVIGSSGAELIYAFDGEFYRLNVKMVLNRNGVFSMLFATNSSAYNPNFKRNLSIERKIADVKDIYYKVNNGIMNNNHLIFENTTSFWDDNDDVNKWYQPRFSFEVVEKQ
jgi:hypothetical protein